MKVARIIEGKRKIVEAMVLQVDWLQFDGRGRTLILTELGKMERKEFKSPQYLTQGVFQRLGRKAKGQTDEYTSRRPKRRMEGRQIALKLDSSAVEVKPEVKPVVKRPKAEFPAEFNAFWDSYPRKTSKKTAQDSFRAE